MEAKTKKKVIIWTSVAAILGVGGYFLYKHLKDTGKLGSRKDDTGSQETESTTSSGGGVLSGGGSSGSSSGGGITEDQKALAIAYRVWANSTPELSKKYGKQSQYDLDASSSTPYNAFFQRSYAAGKAEYEKSLQTGGVAGGGTTLEEIAKVAARYGLQIQKNSTKGTFTQAKFGGTLNGVGKGFIIEFASKTTKGANVQAGQMSWRLYSFDLNWVGQPDNMKRISVGLMSYDDGKFSGGTYGGVGVGAKVSGSKWLGKALETLTSQQLDITDYGDLKS